ncbi:Phosphoserine phosphatase [Escovopsis weberi]|uniref:phosphoserine phosphatase n=1 Tax=Escovopsis weberi TaxID=150374 RepID=A0A0M9VVD9_ESCWE|nr:Phosphoserine phosphatase [Escovopsis weberi]
MAEHETSKSPAQRPQLSSSMRSSSYLSDHQQIRRISDRHGIDTVVEDFAPSPSQRSPSTLHTFNGIPSAENPPIVVDSGITHAYSHPNCVPLSGHKTDRLVATLFYKGAAKDAQDAGAAAVKATTTMTTTMTTTRTAGHDADGLEASQEALPPNMAPTTNFDAFPLEPPTHESEQLDHLYGSYVSPLCITSFLYLMSTFLFPDDAEEPHSSHRCLDDQEHPRVVELILSPVPSPQYLDLSDLRKHEAIYRFEQEWNVDVVIQRDVLWRRHPRLVVFDMDSTLITQEVIDLLAENLSEPPDLAERVAGITHRAMMGELEFDESFRERVALLKGLPATIFEKLRPILDVTAGVRDLLRALRRLGVKTAVLSGGFLPLTGWLARELGIDHAHANEVVVGDDGRLTGEVKGVIVGKERKRDLLVEIAAKEGIDLSQVVAVGDGANDLLMLGKAGLGVAWNAKPRVQMEADARLNGKSMLDLLFLFGFSAEEVAMLIAETPSS